MTSGTKKLFYILTPIIILFIIINFMIIKNFRDKKIEKQRAIEFKQAEIARIEQNKIDDRTRIKAEKRRVEREKNAEKERLRKQNEAEEIAREKNRIANIQRQEREKQRILEEKKRDDSYLFYTLRGCKYEIKFKDRYGDYAIPEGIWVVVDFSVENRGNKERMIPSLELVDEYGREHGSDFTYTPNANFNGSDSFTISVAYGTGRNGPL